MGFPAEGLYILAGSKSHDPETYLRNKEEEEGKKEMNEEFSEKESEK